MNVAVGDEVQVDTTVYGVPGLTWCTVTRTNEWSAAVYPIKVQIPERGEGQYKPSEIIEHLRAARLAYDPARPVPDPQSVTPEAPDD